MELTKDTAYLRYVEQLKFQLSDVPKSETENFLSTYLETVADHFEDDQQHGKVQTIGEFINSLESPMIVSRRFKSEINFKPTIFSRTKKFIIYYARNIESRPIITSYMTSMLFIILMILTFDFITGNHEQTEIYSISALLVPVIGVIVFICVAILVHKIERKNSLLFYVLTLGNIIFLIDLVVIISGILNAYKNVQQINSIVYVMSSSLYPGSKWDYYLNTHLDPYIIFGGLLSLSLVFIILILLYTVVIHRSRMKSVFKLSIPILVIILSMIFILQPPGVPYQPSDTFLIEPETGQYYNVEIYPGASNAFNPIPISLIGNITTLNGEIVEYQTNSTAIVFTSLTTNKSITGVLPRTSSPWYWNFTTSEWNSYAQQLNGTSTNGTAITTTIKNSIFRENKNYQTSLLELAVNITDNTLLYYQANGTFVQAENYNSITITLSQVWKTPIHEDYTTIIFIDLSLWACFIILLNFGVILKFKKYKNMHGDGSS